MDQKCEYTTPSCEDEKDESGDPGIELLCTMSNREFYEFMEYIEKTSEYGKRDRGVYTAARVVEIILAQKNQLQRALEKKDNGDIAGWFKCLYEIASDLGLQDDVRMAYEDYDMWEFLFKSEIDRMENAKKEDPK